MMSHTLQTGDCLELLRAMPDDSVDLVFCSPPYEAQRTYGIGFNLKGQDWVDWAMERYLECYRVSRGLVAWVIEGYTKQFRYSASPYLLLADLHRAGVKLRKPAIYRRHGIPGSGGPDWLANKYEPIVCAAKGRLPWSDNTAMGHAPKYRPGGDCTNRLASGDRVGRRGTDNASRQPDGNKKGYHQPKLANPGNVIEIDEGLIVDCGAVGGGNIGSRLASENEAPFPEKLAEFFVVSFCPPGGLVLDPFAGSGTTGAVAEKTGRVAHLIDVREDQIALCRRRLAEAAEANPAKASA